MSKTLIIIPSRLKATRLPGKPLKLINNIPMIVQVYNRAVESKVGEVYVATPDKEIDNIIKKAHGNSVITTNNPLTGTDRVWEACKKLDIKGVDFIINLQGDSPNINPKIIAQLDNLMRKTNSEIGTLAAKIIDNKEIVDPNIVKVKTSKPLNDNNFVRSENFFRTNEIKNISNIYHHIGLYSFTHSALNGYINLSRSENEKIRSLEQMRLLDNNVNINCGLASSLPLSVDVPNELEKIRKIMEYK